MTVTTVQQLAAHTGHDIEVETYVDADTNATVTCITCGMILISFDSRSGKGPCWRCEEGIMRVVDWLPEPARDAGYYVEECDNCGMTRTTTHTLPDDDEWAREQEDSDDEEE